MAIRPVDLQQVVLKSTDATRDAAAGQQQAAAAQQTLATISAKRRSQKTETVQDLDEAGAAAIHERDARSDDGDRDAESERDEPAHADQITLAARSAVPAPTAGRHIDVQA